MRKTRYDRVRDVYQDQHLSPGEKVKRIEEILRPRYTVEHDPEDERFQWLVIDAEPMGSPRESHIIAACYVESTAKTIADALNAAPETE